MMALHWSHSACDDLERLYTFLAPHNEIAAAKVVQSLVSAAENLPQTPRMGERLLLFSPREVRRVFVGSYELRYETCEGALVVLRLWHAREDR